MPIVIRPVEDIDDMIKLSDFFQMIWADGPDVVSFDLGYAILHVGGYASLAWNGDEVVGASFGIRGLHHDQPILHSHVTASTIPGVGYDLKMHQLDWARKQNIPAITWTFDPLVRRNSAFNLTKLGAIAIEFLPNFYGTMTDHINAGDVSDRLLAIWPTDTTGAKPIGDAIENIALADVNGQPQLRQFDATQPYAIYLPEDIERLRKTDLGLVKLWRDDLHNLLENAFESGATIDQMLDDRKALLVTPAKGSA